MVILERLREKQRQRKKEEKREGGREGWSHACVLSDSIRGVFRESLIFPAYLVFINVQS